MYNFKKAWLEVSEDNGGWYMIEGKEGIVVHYSELIVEDEDDYKAAKSFGWSEQAIADRTVRKEGNK